ncbi:unnamed protein product [Rhizophagus irregularis]|nr:unnamed protein product [Rhizophagus irregularis]
MKTLVRPSYSKDFLDRGTLNGGYFHNIGNINNIQRHDDRYSIKAESLDMGVYLQEDTFVSEIKYTKLVYFIIDYQKRNIKVEFDVHGKLYSLENEFNNIEGEIYVEQQRPYWSITIANKFPPRYSIRDDNKRSFKRMTRIQSLRKSNEPLQPHMSDNSEQLGKWVVFRISFNNQANNQFYRFINMIDKARDYSLVSKFNKPLKIVAGSTLNKYVNRSNLDFDILYMIECNLSFNYIHDYNLNEDFFSFLSVQPKDAVIYVLEKIFEEKNHIYNPLLYLRSEIKKRINVSVKFNEVPNHCAMMRKVVVTPTTMYMLPPTMETSNRVIRNYEYKKDNFLRVHFSDEASNPIGSSSGNFNDTFNDALYNRIYYTLNNGIKIGNVHYEFLAFSSSQLRDHSCWFFASTEDLTANNIRKWMGDFSDIKTVAKYAARMGQCFSSTRVIQYVPMLQDLKKKAKIRVGKGAFLMGVLDETKTLKDNEVYCCISDPCNPSKRKVITGTCIVYRNPCFHPGDIRIVKAVYCNTLSNLMDVLVFPSVGYRDIPNQCSGGDLDGDDFTIIYDEHLIPSEAHEPMNYKSKKPKPVDHVTMESIKAFFVNYVFSDQLGKIANAHLAKADSFPNGALHGQCKALAHLHSDAVDFPKTGIPAIVPQELRVERFPDFMEKHDKPSYESEKVLGILYRSIKVVDYERYTSLNFDKRLLYVEGYEKYLNNALRLKRAYDAEIKGVMNQFGIMTEFEVVSGYIINTITKIDKKKPRNVIKSVMDTIIPIRKSYRKKFEEEFYEEGTKIIPSTASDQMKSKAVAWYCVTYGLKDEDMISFPWIVYDILCEIVKNSKIK